MVFSEHKQKMSPDVTEGRIVQAVCSDVRTKSKYDGFKYGNR